MEPRNITTNMGDHNVTVDTATMDRAFKAVLDAERALHDIHQQFGGVPSHEQLARQRIKSDWDWSIRSFRDEMIRVRNRALTEYRIGGDPQAGIALNILNRAIAALPKSVLIDDHGAQILEAMRDDDQSIAILPIGRNKDALVEGDIPGIV
jgi:hypothetical protein